MLLLANEEENKHCAECGADNPVWASMNLGVLLCIECSGIHRSLGVQLSKVRSLEYDEWDETMIEQMQNMGNAKAREIWEYDVSSEWKKPTSTSSRETKEAWIKAKYVTKLFVDPEVIKVEHSSPASSSGTPKKNKKISQVHKEGFLSKKGPEKLISTWNRRWFSLRGKHIYYYLTREDEIPVGVIHLKDAQVRVTESPDRKNCFSVKTNDREYVISAEDSSEMFTWMTAIREGIDCEISEPNPMDMTKSEKFSVTTTRRHSFALNLQHIRHFGMLFKKGNQRLRKDWKSRYCVLYKDSLYYYENQNEELPLGIIDLRGAKVIKGKSSSNSKFHFEIELPQRTYYFYSDSQNQRDIWLDVLSKVVSLL